MPEGSLSVAFILFSRSILRFRRSIVFGFGIRQMASCPSFLYNCTTTFIFDHSRRVVFVSRSGNGGRSIFVLHTF